MLTTILAINYYNALEIQVIVTRPYRANTLIVN